MKKRLAQARPSILGIAAVALLSLVASAMANRAIRDNTINTRDIKDNQVNTRDLRNNSANSRDIRDNQVNTRDIRNGSVSTIDLRDGSVTSKAVRDGSLAPGDLSEETVALAQTSTVFDPRRHDQDDNGDGAVDNPAGAVPGHACCLSWSQGPTLVPNVAVSASDPVPSPSSGQDWRSVVLDPGAYVLQTTAYAEQVEAGGEAIATRLFLGGQPVADGAGGYALIPASSSQIPAPSSRSVAIEVPVGTAAQRQLIQRAVSIGAPVRFADNFLILKTTPR
jgi:hypothetical protein